MDSGLIYYMYLTTHEYYYSACRCWVTKKEVKGQYHIFLFLLHEVIFVPVNMDTFDWILFAILPANLEILVIDSWFDPTTRYHVLIYRTILCFIDDYQQSKSLSKDQWAWNMHTFTVKKQVNNDECGVCLSLGTYCLVHGLDNIAIHQRSLVMRPACSCFIL
jgi:hypothetical protein